MGQLISDQWSQWAFAKIIVFAALVYFILRVLQYTLKIINVKYDLNLSHQKFFPVLEMITWISFIYWALKEAINEQLYYSVFFIAISLIFLGWLGWYAGRDYFAGIIWRSQDTYEVGQKLIINKINGRITKLGYLNLVLEKNDGTLIKVPYSKITGNIHYNKNENKLVSTYTYSIEVPQKEFSDNYINMLWTSLVNSPWHLSYIEPQIKKIGEEGNKIILEIVFHSFGEEGMGKLESLINKQIANKNV